MRYGDFADLRRCCQTLSEQAFAFRHNVALTNVFRARGLFADLCRTHVAHFKVGPQKLGD